MAQLVTSKGTSGQTVQARPASSSRPRLVIESLDVAGSDTPLFTICIVAAATAPASAGVERLSA
ncbi:MULTISPECIES: hypothetical protein [Streptomyces]|uniref:Uncharacterized protein n=2 Tax=Streptomyces TaxID=1883 RepID=A0A2U9P227_STRAS|nr:hypothetical protein [Streptomyces actuosus]AWT43324.1 hypothetical protein DMT42_14015 [Streptomyces actuosus]MBM4824507.1 hypothetical protein [Streptomyces actuosus]